MQPWREIWKVLESRKRVSSEESLADACLQLGDHVVQRRAWQQPRGAMAGLWVPAEHTLTPVRSKLAI